MLIPIRCKNCGKPIADVWRYYQKRLKELRGDKAETPIYMDATQVISTAENTILNELGMKRTCCRVHFLTQIDLMEKI